MTFFRLALVFIGGSLGTAAREGLAIAFSPIDDIAIATVAVNLVGAFLLGVLVESLVHQRTGSTSQHGNDLVFRLLGTGFMGGFTTYSALAVDAAQLLGDGRTGMSLVYGVGTVVIGAAAAWAGIAAGTLTHRGREEDG